MALPLSRSTGNGNETKAPHLLRSCYNTLAYCFGKARTSASDNHLDYEPSSYPRMHVESSAKPDTAWVRKQQGTPEPGVRPITSMNKAALQDTSFKPEMRDSMVLFVSSAVVTVFSLSDFRVLHQNPRSIWYFGNILSHVTVGQDHLAVDGQDVLHHIFSLDICKLRRMLEDVNKGGVGRCWKGVIRVPPAGSLRTAMVAQAGTKERLEAVAEMEFEARGAPPQRNDVTAGPQTLTPTDVKGGGRDTEVMEPVAPVQSNSAVRHFPRSSSKCSPDSIKLEGGMRAFGCGLLSMDTGGTARVAGGSGNSGVDSGRPRGSFHPSSGNSLPQHAGERAVAPHSSSMFNSPVSQGQKAVSLVQRQGDCDTGKGAGAGAMTEQRSQNGLRGEGKSAAVVVLSKSLTEAGMDIGRRDVREQQRRRSLTYLRAMMFHPHRGSGMSSGGGGCERSFSGPGSSGRNLSLCSVLGGGCGSGGSGGGGSGVSSSSSPKRPGGLEATGVTVDISAWVPPVPSSRHATITGGAGPASLGSGAAHGAADTAGGAGGLERRVSRLSRRKAPAEDIAYPTYSSTRNRGSNPSVDPIKGNRRVGSPGLRQYLLPLGLTNLANNAGGSQDCAATPTTAPATTAPMRANTVKVSHTDLDEHVAELPEGSSTAGPRNFTFMLPMVLDAHGGPTGMGPGVAQTPSLLLQPSTESSRLRRGLSGNVSRSLSGAQLLLNTAPGTPRATPVHTPPRRVLTGIPQHNDPLATSTFSLSLGPLNLPLVPPLLASSGTSCSGLAIQPAPGSGPAQGGHGTDLHTHPTSTVSNAVFGTSLHFGAAYGSISAANHPALHTSSSAAPRLQLHTSGRSSAASHALLKGTQPRGVGSDCTRVGSVLAGGVGGVGGGLGDSTSRLLSEPTTGTNTISAVGAFTLPANTSPSFVGCLSMNMDRVIPGRQRELAPPLQPPQKSRQPAPVVPQPARMRARIQSWANGDHVISPGISGAHLAWQQISTPRIPLKDQNLQQLAGIQQQQQHMMTLARIEECRAQMQAAVLEQTTSAPQGALATRTGQMESQRQTNQGGMTAISTKPPGALPLVPRAQLALLSPPATPSNPDATIAGRTEVLAERWIANEEAQRGICSARPHPISLSQSISAHRGLQDPLAGPGPGRFVETFNREGEASSSLNRNPTQLMMSTSGNSLREATGARLNATVSGSSRASTSAAQNMEPVSVKLTDVLLPAVCRHAQVPLTGPEHGEGAVLASVSSIPLPGHNASHMGCPAPIAIHSAVGGNSDTITQDNTGGGVIVGATAMATPVEWYRTGTLEHDTVGGAAAATAAAGAAGLPAGLGSAEVEPVCSGFFTVDGAQREVSAQHEQISLAQDLRLPSSSGLPSEPPVSLAGGLGTLKDSTTVATTTLAAATGSRQSLDIRRGFVTTGGMAPRLSLDIRRDGLFSIGAAASQTSLNRGGGFVGRFRRQAATATGEMSIPETAMTAATTIGFSSLAISRDLAGLSVSGSHVSSEVVDVDADGGRDGNGKSGAACYGTSDLLSEDAEAAAAILKTVEEHWHEVWATRAVDPVTGEDVVILAQHDVTAKVVAERQVALLMETEHRLLEQLFPRHILQHITEEWTKKIAALAAMPGKALAPGGDGNGGGASAGRKSAAARGSLMGSFRLQPLATDCSSLATWHEQVTLLFADIKGFTPMCRELQPFQVMQMLNDLFSRWDALLGTYGVHKVETIGDCYFVAGGLFCYDEDGMVVVRDRCIDNQQPDPHHAKRVFEFAKAMLVAASAVPMPTSGEPVQVRVGIHSGPVVSGVVGTRMPRFCLFGDTVTTASRLESTGLPGGIHISETTRQLLTADEQEYVKDAAAPPAAVDGCGARGIWTATRGIEVKGKGRMQTWLWCAST